MIPQPTSAARLHLIEAAVRWRTTPRSQQSPAEFRQTTARYSNICESRSRKGDWLFKMRSPASAIENQSPRSTSAISILRPERGGHSTSHRLLISLLGSQLPSKAHAETTLPPTCRTWPSSRKFPWAAKPVSSWNSRLAASSGSSPSAYSPLQIDQAPISFLAQKGPPG